MRRKRSKINRQSELDFHPSNLDLTNAYYEQYEAVSDVLLNNPKILALVHKDLEDALESETSDDGRGGTFKYTSDTVVRMVVCQIIEGRSFREIIIRIDDSHYLRRFVRIFDGPMMDFTTFNRLKNCISSETWKKINEAIACYAEQNELIEGERLRMDTTAVETNIHWPLDSAQLWDTYRVTARLIERARELDPMVVGNHRLQTRKAKRLYTTISRKASKDVEKSKETLRPLYERLIELTLRICEWSEEVRLNLERGLNDWTEDQRATAEAIANEIAHYRHLGLRVIDQTSRRVLDDENVPNDEKVFSIFEPHTELLKRGKAAKPMEFGHMIQIQQVDGKFITDYDVFEKKPIEYELLEPALKSHKKLFGHYPDVLAADKGYYEDMAAIERLNKKVNLVSIAKKGSRTEEQAERESDPEFRFAQRFRAGVEGTISYLKRMFGLFRCRNKGWEHYQSTVGAAIFTHNVLILTRT